MTFSRMLSTGFILTQLALAHCASGAEPDRSGGIVTDQTTSVAGQDFYRQFTTLWSDRPPLEFFSITVLERPSARRGRRIVVEYAQRTLFEAQLPASRAGIEQVSDDAVQIVYEHMANQLVQRLLFSEQDLAADEF
ncbi:CsgE family curli-type amyloid fiber assembly protein [Massilia sp. CCM 8734]|uniref:CsgE family curli-type amyloid fiber assembly protein n=1 Tax=Massilia sp. CCM 8734 TaxID=2609283 RepID=UPI0014214DE7|nr:CsgE family curli-type amyloid fiber assembly protein [Massilia sp. CCM 8734]